MLEYLLRVSASFPSFFNLIPTEGKDYDNFKPNE